MRYVVVLGLLCATAWAQAPREDGTAPARQHFEAGRRRYQAHQYRAALVEFEAAYRLQPAVLLLVDMGQAARLAGEAQRAVGYYRAYLRAMPNAADRAQVESLIAELEQRGLPAAAVTTEPAATTPPPPSAPPSTTVTTPAPSAPPGMTMTTPTPVQPAAATATTPARAGLVGAEAARAGRGRRIAGAVVGATGVAALVAGVACALLVQRASDQLSRLPPGGVYDAALDRRAHGEQAAAIASFAAGGAALLSGAVLYGLGVRARRHALALTPRLGRDGAVGLAF